MDEWVCKREFNIITDARCSLHHRGESDNRNHVMAIVKKFFFFLFTIPAVNTFALDFSESISCYRPTDVYMHMQLVNAYRILSVHFSFSLMGNRDQISVLVQCSKLCIYRTLMRHKCAVTILTLFFLGCRLRHLTKTPMPQQ
jgi:hypothetical protein